ncbi:MAG: hypothetical protein IT210_06275 [Armatimonadetes bacterium]|nr:hypothetical protein [Armatimonadota bacterium]
MARAGMPGAGAPPAAFQLTGVVGGKNRLAVLRGSGEERYFVRKGDRIGGQYRVAAITPHEVTLSGAQGKVTIKIGKDSSQTR